MAATTKRMLTENPYIAHRMIEHLRTYSEKALRSEEFQIVATLVGDQPRVERL